MRRAICLYSEHSRAGTSTWIFVAELGLFTICCTVTVSVVCKPAECQPLVSAEMSYPSLSNLLFTFVTKYARYQPQPSYTAATQDSRCMHIHMAEATPHRLLQQCVHFMVSKSHSQEYVLYIEAGCLGDSRLCCLLQSGPRTGFLQDEHPRIWPHNERRPLLLAVKIGNVSLLQLQHVLLALVQQPAVQRPSLHHHLPHTESISYQHSLVFLHTFMFPAPLNGDRAMPSFIAVGTKSEPYRLIGRPVPLAIVNLQSIL